MKPSTKWSVQPTILPIIVWVDNMTAPVQIEPSSDDLTLTKKPQRDGKRTYPTSFSSTESEGLTLLWTYFSFFITVYLGVQPNSEICVFFMPAVSIPVVFFVLGGALSSTQRPLIPEAFASSAMPWTDKVKQRTNNLRCHKSKGHPFGSLGCSPFLWDLSSLLSVGFA